MEMLYELDYVKDNPFVIKLFDQRMKEFNKNRGERFMFMVNCIQSRR